MKHLLAITIALLPTAALAQQFTPQQMLDVMTKSPSNRDVRVHDGKTDFHGYHGVMVKPCCVNPPDYKKQVDQPDYKQPL